MTRTIHVSTGGRARRPVLSTVDWLVDAGLDAIELSSGVGGEGLLDGLRARRSRARFQVHNYFPPPDVPFVLNLATRDPELGRVGMEHCRRAMEWAVELGTPRYAFHAGYLLDPRVEQLGRKLDRANLVPRAEGRAIFVDRVGELAEHARRLGCELLIENNVVAAFNLESFGCDPFLCSEPEETREILDALPDSVGLLIDVAHLKVSAKTLGYDPHRLFELCGDRVRGYHLSDNDGTADSNHPFTADSWFWPHLDPRVDYVTLEVYVDDAAVLREQVLLARRMLGDEGDRD